MYYESKEYPKEIRHIVSLTAEDVRLAIKEAIKKEYPFVPLRPHIKFSKDMWGVFNVDVTWTEIER